MDLPFGQSRLRKAIGRGLANGDLRGELRELGDITLKSRTDAKDVCWALQQINRSSAKLAQQTDALARLFQEVAGRDCDAFQALQERGIPELLRLFDEISATMPDDGSDTLMFILKILSLYGTTTGTLKIIEAARLPLKPEAYMWNVILRNFIADHPEKDLLFNSLRAPLPGGFIAVSLLDAANAVLLEDDSTPHPFDTDEGRQRLRDWLSSSDEGQFSYAHSAAAALPFISNPDRDRMLDIAQHHPEISVQIEGACSAARSDKPDGIQRLAKYSLDFKAAQQAKQCLSELGREDAIPPEANEPGFAALAEFANWLSHPNELGRMPDSLELVDQRVLAWPPERQLKPFWLLKYTLRATTGLEEDDVGCGLVGSVTFCFFSYKLVQRPTEDAYAVHCYWEMEQKRLLEESDVRSEPKDYENLLNEWTGAPLSRPQIQFVAELSPELGYPQRLVGLAAASINNEPGWVVLDGNRTEWYPQSEQPHDSYESVVLKIHIGRHLLGFTNKPERKRFLSPPRPPRPAEQIIAAYEKLLAEARASNEEKRKEAFGSFSPIKEHFDQYIDALQRSGRSTDVRRLVADLAPWWDSVDGCAKLGKAACKSRHLDLAEQFFQKYRHLCMNYERGEEMALLAEIWCRGGKPDAARDLLLDCLHRLLEASKAATGSDKALFEKWFQNQRLAFLKLFPDEHVLLAAQSIPSSTLPPAE